MWPGLYWGMGPASDRQEGGLALLARCEGWDEEGRSGQRLKVEGKSGREMTADEQNMPCTCTGGKISVHLPLSILHVAHAAGAPRAWWRKHEGRRVSPPFFLNPRCCSPSVDSTGPSRRRGSSIRSDSPASFAKHVVSVDVPLLLSLTFPQSLCPLPLPTMYP
jgi:hypothetical protein